MKKIKKILRVMCFIALMIMSACMLGFGILFSNNKEGYMDNEIKVEQTDKKKDEHDEAADELKN